MNKTLKIFLLGTTLMVSTDSFAAAAASAAASAAADESHGYQQAVERRRKREKFFRKLAEASARGSSTKDPVTGQLPADVEEVLRGYYKDPDTRKYMEGLGMTRENLAKAYGKLTGRAGKSNISLDRVKCWNFAYVLFVMGEAGENGATPDKAFSNDMIEAVDFLNESERQAAARAGAGGAEAAAAASSAVGRSS
tara:strand:- start:12363 stop:12947 length:585 start_codon:yes stop_codon:yes gene_type:complete